MSSSVCKSRPQILQSTVVPFRPPPWIDTLPYLKIVRRIDTQWFCGQLHIIRGNGALSGGHLRTLTPMMVWNTYDTKKKTYMCEYYFKLNI